MSKMKTYIKPEIKCIEIECEGMIAASPEISRTPATSDACSKGFIDDFEDEDYDDDNFGL